ncbi:Phosphoglycolate phosphatase [Kingella potus]|uniref:Phosphoglycolate phosphatase n=1 Tax=Kingella potus TaxID=265175 RepID=A0A377R3S4_9NEIS|nr:phosphoglycolate phosphatase [Kingella potus]UOP01836.1 phosphoglycolate phosphatase [Kingella potus]STR00961.1 Phosphoglycolate phosphatase [Kingella potus]
MQPAVHHVQAAAFDLDGTLCDSVPDLAAAANAMRQALGLPALPQPAIESYVGDGIASLVHRTLTADFHGQADEKQWEQGYTLFVRRYAAHIADATRPYPGTEAGLELLKSLGIPLAVVTNKSETLAVRLLRAIGLADCFSIIVGGDTLPEKKPSPAPLLHAAETLGVPPQNMIMVGDSRNDILAARAAGCPAVGVSYGYGDMASLAQDPATRPDWIISSLPEIYEHLRPQRGQDAEAV